MGIYTAKTDEITRQYFDSIMFTPRYLDSDLADTSLELFGRSFQTPIMTAALSHLHKICDNALYEFARGAKLAGAVHFFGMSEEDELDTMLSAGAATIKVIKPHLDDDVIFNKIRHAVDGGAFGVGMDIDHAIAWNGEYDNVIGLPMHTKTTEQLASYVKAAGIPFIAKGVLSIEDAVKCAAAGAAGIIVSHHHGMMDSMVPPLMMLPEIKKEVGDRMKVFVDCGFERGLDVFKALALGADAVCVGRALMDPLKNGAEGVAEKIAEMNRELKAAMSRTGARTLREIDPSVLRFRSF